MITTRQLLHGSLPLFMEPGLSPDVNLLFYVFALPGNDVCEPTIFTATDFSLIIQWGIGTKGLMHYICRKKNRNQWRIKIPGQFSF